jgi:hypothetical protein
LLSQSSPWLLACSPHVPATGIQEKVDVRQRRDMSVTAHPDKIVYILSNAVFRINKPDKNIYSKDPELKHIDPGLFILTF